MSEVSSAASKKKLQSFLSVISAPSYDLFEDVTAVYHYYFSKVSLKDHLKQLESDVYFVKEFVTDVCSQIIPKFNKLISSEEFKVSPKDVIGLAQILADLKEGERALDDSLRKSVESLTDAFFEKCHLLSNADPLKKFADDKSPLNVADVNAVEVAVDENLLSVEGKIQKLFSEMSFSKRSKKKFSFSLMDCISSSNEKIVVSFETFKKATECLIIARSEVDVRVCDRYLFVFRYIFMHVADDQEAMTYFYNLPIFVESVGHVPNLRDNYKNFDSDINKIMNCLTDINNFSLKENIPQLARQLAFLLMIAPKPAIRLVILFCINSKPLVPSFMQLLERIPAFFQLRVFTIDETNRKELLMISLFRRFLNAEPSVDLKKDKQRDSFEYLLLTLVRTQFKKPVGCTDYHKNVMKKPLFDATELLRDFIFDHCSRSLYLEMLLQILDRLLQVYEDKCWVINWGSAEDNDAVDPCALIYLLIDIYSSNKENTAVQKLIPQILHSLAIKLKVDKIMLSKSDFVVEKLNIFDWSLKYCVCRWMASSVSDLHYQIPKVLYDSLAPKVRSKFIPIEGSSDLSQIEDFILSIFELGMVSVDEAKTFLDNELILKPSKVLSPMIADGLLRAIRSNTNADVLSKLQELIDKLFSVLDVPIGNYYTDCWTESIFTGMRQIAPILTLSDALRIYFHELLSQEKKSVSWVKDVDGVGHLLMDTFCNSVSSYIAKEFAPLKQKDIIFTTAGFGTLVETQVIAAINQLTVFAAVTRTLEAKILFPMPSCLKSLRQNLSSLSSQLGRKLFVDVDRDRDDRQNRNMGAYRQQRRDSATSAAVAVANSGGNGARNSDPAGQNAENDVAQKRNNAEGGRKGKYGRNDKRKKNKNAASGADNQDGCLAVGDTVEKNTKAREENKAVVNISEVNASSNGNWESVCYGENKSVQNRDGGSDPVAHNNHQSAGPPTSDKKRDFVESMRFGGANRNRAISGGDTNNSSGNGDPRFRSGRFPHEQNGRLRELVQNVAFMLLLPKIKR